MASTRRLAAILAADVAGYSRLMGADEEGTHERFKAHFQQLINPKINEHQGRVVKNTGGGALVEFASVVDAVRCAAEIQRGMLDRDTDMPDERRIKLRIGINLGDVIAEPEDIYGDGVNIAARLEAVAEPGGICISGAVYDQIRDRPPYSFDDMGEQSVKNIARPVRVYGLSPAAVGDLPASAMPAASISPPSLHTALVKLVSVLAFLRPRGNAFALKLEEFRLDRADDGGNDLVLQLEQLGPVTVISPSPEMGIRLGVDQLGGDADLVSRPLDASCQHIAHTKLAADLLRVDQLVPVRESGIARDHEHVRDPRQIGCQILGDPVGEILLPGVAAEVGKGQDDDR